MTDFKARIDVTQGIIELEGSEEFVSKYLDEFRESLRAGQKFTPPPKSISENGKTRTASASGKAEKANKKPIKVSSLKAEAFDDKASGGKPSLSDFFESKSPNSTAPQRIAVIGYYVTNIKGNDRFTEGNAEFAYKVLGLTPRPLRLRQAFIDTKNKNGYIDEVTFDDGTKGWQLERLGEILVEDKLPAKAK